MVIKAVSDLISDDAVISLDCGANTHFAARHLMLRANQRLTGTGMMASMAPGTALRHRGSACLPRSAVGFAMLMAEMTTAVQHNLPVKIIILKNNSLAEVKFEQMELGNPSFGCELRPIDFVAFARACGAEGYRCEEPQEIGLLPSQTRFEGGLGEIREPSRRHRHRAPDIGGPRIRPLPTTSCPHCAPTLTPA